MEMTVSDDSSCPWATLGASRTGVDIKRTYLTWAHEEEEKSVLSHFI